MAHFEGTNGGGGGANGGRGPWQTTDALAHLPTHTPIQVPCQDGSIPAGAFMQQSTWRFQPPFGGLASAQQNNMFRPSWQPSAAEWPTANNNKNEWEKWGAAAASASAAQPPVVTADLARPMPQLGLLLGQAALPAPSPMLPQQIQMKQEEVSTTSEHIITEAKPTFEHSPKEEDADKHTASYDVSASQSPSEPVSIERREEAGAATTTTEEKEHEPMDHQNHEEDEDEEDHIDVENTQPAEPTVVEGSLDTSAATTSGEAAKEEEASRLLLSFSQQSFTTPSDDARLSYSSQESKIMEFQTSDNSAFSNPDTALAMATVTSVAITPTTPETPASSSFCRPPGLGPSLLPPPEGQNAPLVCPICGFSCKSKFHYNSHMNTHGDHQCTMCDYTSRTEGRLKKHMRESHTVEEQLAAGLEIEPRVPTPSSSGATGLSTSFGQDTSTLSTTMASLVDAANAAAAGHLPETAPSLSTALSLEGLVSSSGLLSSIAPTSLPSALDQIRAFAEKSSLFPDSTINLANAFGVQLSDDSPEKNENNSEPRRNSNGKIKQLKCKQCPHVSFSKNDQWAHARTHIPLDKQMNCNRCNFVTEYKHHLEYHKNNHDGKKPFQCTKCSYQCVNKSMLNSHMKSHTNVYHFRCLDCNYATKYCHSLKLHLKKYGHRRRQDGLGDLGDSPPSQVKPGSISPYHIPSQFRSPSTAPATSLAQSLGLATPIVTSQSLNYASQMLLRQHQSQMEQMNLMGLNGLAALQHQQQHQPVQHLQCTLCEAQCSSQEEMMRHNMSHIMASSAQSPMVSLYQSLPQMSGLLPSMPSMEEEHVTVDTHETESGNAGDDEMEGSSGSTGSPIGSSKGSGDEDSRKRKGFKVDQIGERLLGKSPSGSECGSHCDKDNEEHMESSLSPAETSMVPQATPTSAAFAQLSAEPRMNLLQHLANLNSVFQAKRDDWRFQCQHCRMAFQEQALYQIHMGYHGYEHVFKCNRCGYIANDSLGFNLHLLQASHE